MRLSRPDCLLEAERRFRRRWCNRERPVWRGTRPWLFKSWVSTVPERVMTPFSRSCETLTALRLLVLSELVTTVFRRDETACSRQAPRLLTERLLSPTRPVSFERSLVLSLLLSNNYRSMGCGGYGAL